MENPLSAPLIFFASIFTNNILLANFLGMCSFLAISREIPSAVGLGLAVTFVMTCTTALNYLVYHYLLVPFQLVHFRFIAFIVVIAAFVQLVEMVIDRYSPRLYVVLGVFLPLITVNCAILGVCLFMVIRQYNFVQSVAYGFGGGLGWLLAIVALAGIREKLKKAPIPKALEGPGISLIVAGLMALSFMAFSGMISMG
ncbi:NADH:ubiquinone reductase (Na(+)-transporting) subunit E [Desulfosoma caldarium]|uniref:Ion-translocating oxidoreductase complex subunit A n=1 Tax=Desulfosoma caldarium TaxID=610254 RepID=A0A3N1VL17_9BACT|nr:Rnf-Nqr domain containing protein [Desulfosoma caldarium]ROR01641.1 Na+-transporting NADH:ubiquinone oxidoreductase subunit E [Desulfosoma caldarium]